MKARDLQEGQEFRGAHGPGTLWVRAKFNYWGEVAKDCWKEMRAKRDHHEGVLAYGYTKEHVICVFHPDEEVELG